MLPSHRTEARTAVALLVGLALATCRSPAPGAEAADDGIPYPEVAALIVERMQLETGESVLVFGQTGVWESLVPPLRDAIVAAGGELVGVVSGAVPPESAAAAQPSAFEYVGTQDADELVRRFAPVDATVILPAAHGALYGALLRLLEEHGGSRRTVHFHWAGAFALEGNPLPVDSRVNSTYARALLETDYDELAARLVRFEQALRAGEVRVTTPAGTDIRFRIGDRPVTRQDGDASAARARRARNLIDREVELPAGAVRVAPLEDTVHGVIAFPDATWAGRPVQGLRMWFEEGRVVRIEAERGQDAVEAEVTAAGEAARRFREFALGFNPLLAIADPDDPWIPYFGYGAGIVRLSLGDNTELGDDVTGGYVRWNFFPHATVTVAGETWVQDGILLP